MIANLTQHPATPSQKEAGVVDLTGEDLVLLKQLLTFDTLPTTQELYMTADSLARLAWIQGSPEAMIGGAPYLMKHLEESLRAYGIKPLYSFTQRNVTETKNEDGTVTKTAVFEHLGFVGD